MICNLFFNDLLFYYVSYYFPSAESNSIPKTGLKNYFDRNQTISKNFVSTKFYSKDTRNDAAVAHGARTSETSRKAPNKDKCAS